jgi:hypothetical protein
MEFWPTTPEERVEAFRTIVRDKTFAKIDGTAIDLTTASFVCQILDAINDDNKRKFIAMDAKRMALIALKLANGK